MLDTALSVISTPLRKDAPLWAVTLLTGLEDGRVALVLVPRSPMAWAASRCSHTSWTRYVRRRRAGFLAPCQSSPRSPGMRSSPSYEPCAAAGSHGACCATQLAQAAACTRRAPSAAASR
jgi:hypothetical protein